MSDTGRMVRALVLTEISKCPACLGAGKRFVGWRPNTPDGKQGDAIYVDCDKCHELRESLV